MSNRTAWRLQRSSLFVTSRCTASRGDRGPFCKAQKLERRGELSCSSVFFERLQENITKNGCSFIELCRALNCMWSEKVVVVAIIAFFHADLPWLKNEHFLDHCTPITNKVSRASFYAYNYYQECVDFQTLLVFLCLEEFWIFAHRLFFTCKTLISVIFFVLSHSGIGMT